MALINLFPIPENEKVTAVIAVSGLATDGYLLMATSLGEIKKTSVSNFSSVRSSGLIAMDLSRSDSLVAATLATEQDDIIMVTQQGQSVRFPVSELRTSLRASGGVRAVRLVKDDRVISADVAWPDTFLVVITFGGYGKITPIKGYPRQHRAGSGVRTFKTTEKTGLVVAAKVVIQSQQLMIISADGMITRTPVKEKDPRRGITVQGRSTQGVKLMNLTSGDSIVAIASFE